MKVLVRCLIIVMAGLLIVFSSAPARAESGQAPAQVDAKIEIVWPHDNLPVQSASLVNVTAYLFMPGTRQAVPCDFAPTLRLWRALNNQPAENVATGSRRLLTQGGVTFPAWDFNDVDVSAARDPLNKYYFYVTVDGVSTNFNIWSHGANPLTYLPNPVPPLGTAGSPDRVDARIQIVWPHDPAGNLQPVSGASRANVSVALFYTGTRTSVSPDFNQPVWLYRASNNGPLQWVGSGLKRVTRVGDVVYPVWDFNDVDVSGARDPANKYYFRVLVANTQTFSTIWSHGADARTLFPRPDQPIGGCSTSAAQASSPVVHMNYSGLGSFDVWGDGWPPRSSA